MVKGDHGPMKLGCLLEGSTVPVILKSTKFNCGDLANSKIYKFSKIKNRWLALL